MSTWYIEKKVEIDIAAASSHMETKREIDYMQIDIAKKDLVIDGCCGRYYALYTFLYRPKSKL